MHLVRELGGTRAFSALKAEVRGVARLSEADRQRWMKTIAAKLEAQA
jgi:hypothetical protein